MHSPIPYPLIALQRNPKYSPNSIENDTRILNAVIHCLESEGYCIHTCSEKEFATADWHSPIIFGMPRKPATLARLQKLEKQYGTIVINSAFAIANCNRTHLTKIFEKFNVPQPRNITLNVKNQLPTLSYPCWMKRNDGHSIEKEDTVFITNSTKAKAVLEKFRKRGITRVVLSPHLRGDLVKFYGVTGTPFFYTFYPTATHYSKFGLERHNGAPKGYVYDERLLNQLATQAAKSIGLEVYGGDCIVQKDGSIFFIDFNDWPSFANCRLEAAPHIAQRIIDLIPKTK